LETKKIEVLMQGIDQYLPVPHWEFEDRWYFQLPVPWGGPNAKAINEEVRAMQNAKWHPETKVWSVAKTQRNKIALDFLIDGRPDPFTRYDREIVRVETERPLWDHQHDMLDFIMTRHYCMLAADPGTGKTLPLIEAMERSGAKVIWYVSTVAGLEAVRQEFIRWDVKVKPRFITYNGVEKIIREYNEHFKNEEYEKIVVPDMIIFDESQRLKNETTGWTSAAQWLTDAVREHWGENGFVILATGTPSPRNPLDWWKQIEIVQPGYLREGSVKQFQKTMELVEWKDSKTGPRYPEHITWWDDENKCQHCGKYCDQHGPHKECFKKDAKGKDLYFTKSVDELSRLYLRLSGLVIVKKKKDCLNLPDKFIRKLYCEPDEDLLKQAQKIVDMSPSAIEAVCRLRELSDGFLYHDEERGTKTCPTCKGAGEVAGSEPVEEYEFSDDEFDDVEDYYRPQQMDLDLPPGVCTECRGEKIVPNIVRTYTEVASPKFALLRSLMEQNEDNGRLVVFAGFQASIDRIAKLGLDSRWTVFQIDGRRWRGITPSGDVIAKKDMLQLFQDPSRKLERVMIAAHPQSGGVGLNLTAAHEQVFFSHTYRGEDYQQAVERGHRQGMDLVKGLTITHLINLKTDELILENNLKKDWMQQLTLGVITDRLTGEVIGRVPNA
jgi:SNF2 family DNA or RNA helicase